MRMIVVIAALGIAGCQSVNTGIIRDGDGYRIMRQAGTGATTSGKLQQKNYNEAEAYCRSQGKIIETLSTDSKQARPLGGYPEANLRFRCVAGSP